MHSFNYSQNFLNLKNYMMSKISETPKIKIVLSFHSVTDISKFKHECGCSDFYLERDLLTLVGTFTEEQLKIATNKYSAMCKIEHE